MYTLRLLGGISLSTGDGREVDAILRQPKAVALLAYLALPRPGTWHRRDALLAAFWPELDQARARAALRSALYALRQHLPEGAVRSRGDDEVSIDPEAITTDAGSMADAADAGRHADVLTAYRGELLPALHISEAEGFEKWLEQERSRLASVARRAAALLTEHCEKAGDLAGAAEAARRGAELDPTDETAARRWISALDRSGDRAQALAVFERVRASVLAEYGVEPSNETIRLGERLRTRPAVNGSPRTAAAPDIPSPAKTSAPELPPEPINLPAQRRRATVWRWGAGTMLLAGALLVVIVFRTTRSARAATGSRRLVVLPMDYEAGDSSLAYVAAGLAEGVARRLNGVGGLEVRSGARSEWPAATRRDFKEIARRFGSTVMLRTSLARAGDSLEVRASVVDAESATETPVRPRRFAVADIRDAESVLAASVGGALFQKPLPAASTAVASIDPESYRLMLQGVYQLLTVQDLKAARKSFEESARIDASNARAWAGLSSVWAAQTVTDRVPFEDGFERATAAAQKALALDSLQGSAWANLGLLRALKERKVSVGKALMHTASAVEPSNPEVLLIKSALFRNAWRWDEARDAIRLARELDPLSPLFMEREASVELCADRPQAALRLVDAELVLSPSDRLAQTARVRSLARLRRFDDAIAAWRALALAARSDSLAVVLSRARGEGGYWAARHLEGRRTRERLEKGVPQLPWVSSLVAIQVRFAAGDTAEAFAALDAAAREPLPALYRLPCMPDLDEVRRTPHYRAIVARIGALPER